MSLAKAAAAYQLRLITDTVTYLDPEQHQAWLGTGEPLSYRSVVLTRGRWPLLLWSLVDRRYLKARTGLEDPGATFQGGSVAAR